MRHASIIARQFKLMVIVFVVGDAFIYVPGALAAYSFQDAWIASIITFFEGMVLVALYQALEKQFPSITFLKYGEVIFGKWIGKTILLLILFFLFVDSSLMVFEIADFTITEIMPETPSEFLIILILIPILYASSLGIKAIARSVEILFPFVFVMFLYLFFYFFLKLISIT